MPRDTRDMVRQFVAFETERRRLGLASAMSHWRVLADRFTWQLEGSRMRANFPQVQQSVELELRTWSCEDEAPKPFELCMSVTVGGETLRFYSREDWRVDPGKGEIEGDVPFRVEGLLPQDALAEERQDEPATSASRELPPSWRASGE